MLARPRASNEYLAGPIGPAIITSLAKTVLTLLKSFENPGPVLSRFIYLLYIWVVCLSVCVSLTMCLCIKMLTWVLFMMVKDEKKTCPSVCVSVCVSEIVTFLKKINDFQLNMTNKWKDLETFFFGIELYHKTNNKCVEFETDLAKYRSTTPICLFTVWKCHYSDMA